MKLAEVLKTIKENSRAFDRLGVSSLAVFGSTARGDALPESDIDILVRFVHPPTFDQYMDTRIMLEDLLGHRVDLVTEEGLKPLVRKEVEKEAVYAS